MAGHLMTPMPEPQPLESGALVPPGGPPLTAVGAATPPPPPRGYTPQFSLGFEYRGEVTFTVWALTGVALTWVSDSVVFLVIGRALALSGAWMLGVILWYKRRSNPWKQIRAINQRLREQASSRDRPSNQRL